MKSIRVKFFNHPPYCRWPDCAGVYTLQYQKSLPVFVLFSLQSVWLFLFYIWTINCVHDRTHHHCKNLVVLWHFCYIAKILGAIFFVEIGCQVSTINFLGIHAWTILLNDYMFMVSIKITIQVWVTIPVWWWLYTYDNFTHMGNNIYITGSSNDVIVLYFYL